jgi:hypothetical protein
MNKGDNKLTNRLLQRKEHNWNLTKLRQLCIEENMKSM